MDIHFVTKQARWPLFFIAFLKCSKHNYQLDQVLENFKYSFYFDGITLKCYYDQKYEFFVLSIFRKYKYILLTVQSFKSTFLREVQLF